MPVDETGESFASPGRDPAASLPLQVLVAAAAVNEPQFITGAIEDLEAQLFAHPFLRTALAGADNDIDWVQAAPGAVAVDIAYINPGANNAALNIVASAAHIVVNLATGAGGAITTTANDIVAAVKAGAASQYVKASVQAGNSGAGVVTALAATPVADWVATTLDVKLQVDPEGTGDWQDSNTPAFAQVAAVAGSGKTRTYSALGELARWVVTVGGATHICAFSLAARKR